MSEDVRMTEKKPLGYGRECRGESRVPTGRMQSDNSERVVARTVLSEMSPHARVMPCGTDT